MEAQPLRCPNCDSRFDAGSSFCNHDGAKLVPASDEAETLVGSVLADRYRIVKLLGQGGMGRVYEAQHVNINKRLAIKVLRPEVTAVPSTVARFRQEARSASSIGHENIIEIEDFATLPDGTVYLAMELLEGDSLGDRMRQMPPLTLAEAIDLMVQVGRGLAAAHDKGIVHRDMKPENVFLARKYDRLIPKILDFGIAKVSGEEGNTNLTQTGAIFGTPLYMSPEQAMGQPLDHRADIYSVGVILYELAVGRVPFKADSAVQVLSQHITMQPELPSKAAPNRGVPPELDALILRAMAKEPAARFQTMTELVAELQSVSRLLSSSAPVALGASSQLGLGAASQLGLSQLEIPAQRSKTPLYAALLLLLLIVGGGAMWALRKPPPATPIEKNPPVVVEKSPPIVVEKTPPAPQKLEVVVTSMPPGAKMLRDGELLAETPDAIQVPAGETWKVVLHKDGFADQPVTIDPSRDRKMLVKLDKLQSTRPSASLAHVKQPPGGIGTKSGMVVNIPAPAAKPAPPPPPKPAAPSDGISASVEKLAASSAPGGHRVGNFYSGHANDDGEHSDWFMTLELGKCYDFVANGGPGVEELYVYLWGPNGKRVTDRKEGSPGVTLHYCAAQPGSYHFQAKVAGGKGDYRVGLYQR
jgi:serine/threonine-protein kinase